MATCLEEPPMSTPRTVVPLGTSAWFITRPAVYATPAAATSRAPSMTSLERPFFLGLPAAGALGAGLLGGALSPVFPMGGPAGPGPAGGPEGPPAGGAPGTPPARGALGTRPRPPGGGDSGARDRGG